MLNLLTADRKQSNDVFKACEDDIRKKECYTNIFKVATSSLYCKKFLNGEWKVAYGYMESGVKGLYIRHCFIVDKDLRVIDPTVVPKTEREYLVFAVISFADWLDKIADNDFRPDCVKQFLKEETLAREYAKEHNLILIG